MRRLALSCSLLILTLLPSAHADAPQAEPLQPFARFVGGAWESDGEMKVRVVYEWGLNKKLLKIKSFLVGKDGPRLVYESSVYWHPEKKQVIFQSTSATGGIFEGVMTPKDNVYTSVFTSFEGDKATPFRQTLEFIDDDTVTWTVFGKKGDEWVSMHQARQKRVKDAAK